VVALVRAFLKAEILTELGDREESHSGAPQGGPLSPLLANIALSAVDEHFHRQWQESMGTGRQRAKRRRLGLGNWRLIRFADLCRTRNNSTYAGCRVMPGGWRCRWWGLGRGVWDPV
jgi:retron-type reverse transcriptase